MYHQVVGEAVHVPTRYCTSRLPCEEGEEDGGGTGAHADADAEEWGMSGAREKRGVANTGKQAVPSRCKRLQAVMRVSMNGLGQEVNGARTHLDAIVGVGRANGVDVAAADDGRHGL